MPSLLSVSELAARPGYRDNADATYGNFVIDLAFFTRLAHEGV